MARERPINAPEPSPGKARRRALPLPLKLIAGAVLVAAVFIVAAILGGGGGESRLPGAAPQVGGSSAPKAGEPEESEQTAAELGYPAFATKNTTRIGGDGPAAVAAGAALAVFPSTAEGERPAAVSVVGEEDWAGGIAAAVLMAPPVRAPILLSGPEQMPAPTIDALAALAPRGSPATGGHTVFAIGAAAAPGGSGTLRIDEREPAALGAAVAKLRDRLFGSAPRHYVIAAARQPAFAMPAAAWAARSGDPVLFTDSKRLSPPTAAVLRGHSKVPAFVLGPPSAISSDVLRQIGRITRVRRVSGGTAVRNSIALARYDREGFGWNVNDPGHGFVVARSDQPLDAAAAAPLSASGTWGPLLLSDDADRLPEALRGYFLDVKPGYESDPTRAFYNHVWVIGDQEAIGVGEQAEIDSVAELAKIGGGP